MANTSFRPTPMSNFETASTTGGPMTMTPAASPTATIETTSTPKTSSNSSTPLATQAGTSAYNKTSAAEDPIAAGMDNFGKGWEQAEQQNANQQYGFTKMSTPSGVLSSTQVSPVDLPKTQ